MLIIFISVLLIGVLIIFLRSFVAVTEQPRETLLLRILVLASTFTIIIPIKVILNISGFFSIYVVIVATVLLTKFFTSIYTDNYLPSINSIFINTLFSLTVIIFIYPLAYYLLNIVFELRLFNYNDYMYLFIVIHSYVLEPVSIEGIYNTNRTRELQEVLRAERSKSQILDYNCLKAYERYLKEANSAAKREKFRALMSLVGERRDLCRELDRLANNKSASTAFKNRVYSRFVADFIRSLGKK